MERRLSRYPQLYSRIGFAHEYWLLSVKESVAVIAHHWGTLGLQVPSGEFNDPDVIAAFARARAGNLRLVRRLLTEIFPYPRGQQARLRHQGGRGDPPASLSS